MKQNKPKKKGKEKKKEGVMGMKTNELGLSHIPVLGGYLNFLHNLWFWFFRKIGN
jgi:hypothetical protein